MRGSTVAETARKHTEVAVGILLREDGAMLLSTRPPGKPYAGYWEFPGGKLEAGETVEEALVWINQRPHPLALYLFDDSAATQKQVLHATQAGGVCLNETLVHIAQHDLPFGGVGASGMGHYHGQFGFDAMSKLKPVFRQSRLNALGLLAPPYGGLVGRVLRVMLRR